MKVALVHDYLSEFGGAERVLLALHEMFPDAPIYTAFARIGSPAVERFKDAAIYVSWAQKIPWFTTKLHSPLRFLAPLIWESFNFDEYDLVISSASWYITKGILTGPRTTHISYIHTPPRYLYGYPTSIEWKKYLPVRIYGNIVNHYLREYDFLAAQRPDVLVANSENTRQRIQKFYRRDAAVVYPPVCLIETPQQHALQSRGLRPRVMESQLRGPGVPAIFPSEKSGPSGYFLIVSRVVGGKGLKLAVQACSQLELPLKIVGQSAGWSSEEKEIKRLAGPTIEFLGAVSDEELCGLYAGAKAFLAVAEDEDFGITPVEAMMAGTPVIAYRGGGYLETVVESKTGVFFDDYSIRGLKKAINSFNIQHSAFNINTIQHHARKFSKAQFIKKMNAVIDKAMNQKA